MKKPCFISILKANKKLVSHPQYQEALKAKVKIYSRFSDVNSQNIQELSLLHTSLNNIYIIVTD